MVDQFIDDSGGWEVEESRRFRRTRHPYSEGVLPGSNV